MQVSYPTLRFPVRKHEVLAAEGQHRLFFLEECLVGAPVGLAQGTLLRSGLLLQPATLAPPSDPQCVQGPLHEPFAAMTRLL